MGYFLRVTYRFIVLIAFAWPGAAQQPTPPPAPEPQPVPQGTPQPPAAGVQQPVNPITPEQEREIQRKEQSQRILGVVPQFGVTSRQNPPPLTTRQKFHLFAKGAFDPFEFAAAGLQAGISQANNEFPAYGQGAAGYGKRFGASLADEVSGDFFGGFFYPTLLRQDPRYFRLGRGSIQHRILYALAQAFVCRTDKGARSFNYSGVLGAFSSGALSNAYYPESDRGFGLTMSRSAISLAYGSAGGLVDEFWFDINEKLFHKNKQTSSPATPPQPAQHH